MSKRITAEPSTIKLKRTDTDRVRDHVGNAGRPKVNKTPCSLCHQVVEELKYHYDICEPCHQNDMDGSDMEEASTDEEPNTVSSNGGGPADLEDQDSQESDGWESCEEKDDDVIQESVKHAKEGKSVSPSMVTQRQRDSKERSQ